MTPFPKHDFLNTDVFSRISLQVKAGFSKSGSDSHQKNEALCSELPYHHSNNVDIYDFSFLRDTYLESHISCCIQD